MAQGIPKELLELIFRTSRERPVAALLRHSAREEITDARSALEALLPPEGKAVARAFGSGLPADRSVRTTGTREWWRKSRRMGLKSA